MSRAIDCDFLACSAYKFHGPHAGVLSAGRARLLRAARDVPKLRPSPNTAPERLGDRNSKPRRDRGDCGRDRLPPASLAEGRTICRSRLPKPSSSLSTNRASVLVDELWSGLESIEGVKIFGPKPSQPRTPTISFVIEGLHPVDVCRQLAANGIFASHGDFYASTAVERLGLSPLGLVRIGCQLHTTREEIERLLEVIKRAC